MTRAVLTYDVVIVGAGPAGLSSAIRLKQLQPSRSVCVIEKAAEIGNHSLAGTVLNPQSLKKLLPNLQQLPHPLITPVTKDQFWLLSNKRAWRLPTPAPMRNKGNFILSLGQLCRFLAQQAEALGVDLFPGFAAAKTLIEDQQVRGIITGDMGVDKQNKPLSNFQAGIELRAQHTILAEGCRGSLTEDLIRHFGPRAQPQTYALGVKELWQVDNPHHQPGKVLHTVGWPLDNKTYGGSFLYHLPDQKIALGFVVGLDYQNPSLDPFKELQRFKTHPSIREHFAGGERISYGARALNEGGFQSIPRLSYPGASIVGCGAGFLNVPQIKGTHNAIESGRLAAEAIAENENAKRPQNHYQAKLQQSAIWQELYRVRNIRPAFRYGLRLGLLYALVDTYLLRGRAPWTFHHVADHTQLKTAAKQPKIHYPAPDHKLTFDKLSSIYLSHLTHPENQPVHLKLTQPDIAIDVNYHHYGAPETHYCPAGVYEIVTEKNQPTLRINAANCIHCKTCDIKDPKQNITWTPPQGGSGPNYSEM